MSDTNISKATVSNMTNNVPDYSVDSKNTDGVSGLSETEYMWVNWSKWYGYYRKIPELKKAIDAYATYAVGKGYLADPETKVILDLIIGWGEDTFNSILWNMVVVKKVNGDAFAEIIRDDNGNLINLKPLDPASIKVVVNRQGIILRYEQMNKVGDKSKGTKVFKPREIFHISNERVADEIHGISAVEAVEEVILTRNEAISDFKVVLHRNVVPLTIIEVDSDNQSKIDELQKKYEQMIKNKEVIFVPKGNITINRDSVNSNSILNPLPWIEYNTDFFFQAVGVPRIVVGGSQEFTEATAKIAYLTFSQIWSREQRELEADILHQLGLIISLTKPAEIQNELISDEAKDKGTMNAFETGDMTTGVKQE